MVSRYVRRGLPTRTDKKIPWPDGRDWVARNIIPELSGSFASRRAAGRGTAAFCEYVGYARAASEVISLVEQARFARLAQRMGLDPKQCVVLALAHSGYVILALKSLGVGGVKGTADWTVIGEPDWARVLGCHIDNHEVDELYHDLSRIDVIPELAEAHDRELEALCAPDTDGGKSE